MALTGIEREKRTSGCCHIWTCGTEGSRWVNIIYPYSAGVVSSAAHHLLLALPRYILMWHYFFHKNVGKTLQVHWNCAFSKDSSILQMKKNWNHIGKKKISQLQIMGNWFLSGFSNWWCFSLVSLQLTWYVQLPFFFRPQLIPKSAHPYDIKASVRVHTKDNVH